jgi:hypothetical protein
MFGAQAVRNQNYDSAVTQDIPAKQRMYVRKTRHEHIASDYSVNVIFEIFRSENRTSLFLGHADAVLFKNEGIESFLKRFTGVRKVYFLGLSLKDDRSCWRLYVVEHLQQKTLKLEKVSRQETFLPGDVILHWGE